MQNPELQQQQCHQDYHIKLIYFFSLNDRQAKNALPSKYSVQSFRLYKGCGIYISYALHKQLAGACVLAVSVYCQHCVIPSILWQCNTDTQCAETITIILDLISVRPLHTMAILVPGNLCAVIPHVNIWLNEVYLKVLQLESWGKKTVYSITSPSLKIFNCLPWILSWW